jgi:16S rRNA (guanine527-N7)-methyltransferase
MTAQAFMPFRVQLAAGIAALGLDLPAGAEDQLLAYLALLEKWNRVHNLTAVREADRMVSHHLLDSLAVVGFFDAIIGAGVSPSDETTSHSTKPASGQVAGYPQPLSSRSGGSPLKGEGANVGLRPPTAIDVGSGGGLPGIPLAITRPDLAVTLIDSIAKKTAFLLQAKAELGLSNMNVVTGRVEDYRRPHPNPLPQGDSDFLRAEAHEKSYVPHAGEGANVMPKPIDGFNVIVSRAFSDLREFVTLTRHLLAPGGRWLAMKGLYPDEEIAQLPGWVKVSADHALAIPGLDATRHLIVLEPVL